MHEARLKDWACEEVDAVFQALPPMLRQNALRVPVTFEPVPNKALQADGIAPDTLGLFTGADYVEEVASPMPPQIILFLDNLWDWAQHDPTLFRDEVRTTLLHELGHYLGLDEDDLVQRGLE